MNGEGQLNAMLPGYQTRYIVFLLFICACLYPANVEANSSLTVIKGKIMDSKTREPINAELNFYRNSDFIKYKVKTALAGEYSEVLNDFGWYIIEISAPGYLVASDTVWVVSENDKTLTRDYYLSPIEKGLTVTIDHVYFHFGTTILTKESYEPLKAVVNFFKTNPQVSFEIGGHTDNEGPEDYNLALSEGRALAIVDYLVKNGIDASRLTARGYGETTPIDPGETKSAKARNRRVEFKVAKVKSK